MALGALRAPTELILICFGYYSINGGGGSFVDGECNAGKAITNGIQQFHQTRGVIFGPRLHTSISLIQISADSEG